MFQELTLPMTVLMWTSGNLQTPENCPQNGCLYRYSVLENTEDSTASCCGNSVGACAPKEFRITLIFKPLC